MSDTTRNTVVIIVLVLAVAGAIALAVWLPQTASAQEITFPSPLVTPEPIRPTFNRLYFPVVSGM